MEVTNFVKEKFPCRENKSVIFIDNVIRFDKNRTEKLKVWSVFHKYKVTSCLAI